MSSLESSILLNAYSFNINHKQKAILMCSHVAKEAAGPCLHFFHEKSSILTYSMVQSPSWEANRFAASQEIPRLLINPEVHCRIYECTPPVPILSQLDPVYCPHPTSSRSILIVSFHLSLGLPSGLFPSGLPTKPCISLSSPLYALHAPPISFFFIWCT